MNRRHLLPAHILFSALKRGVVDSEVDQESSPEVAQHILAALESCIPREHHYRAALCSAPVLKHAVAIMDSARHVTAAAKVV